MSTKYFYHLDFIKSYHNIFCSVLISLSLFQANQDFNLSDFFQNEVSNTSDLKAFELILDKTKSIREENNELALQMLDSLTLLKGEIDLSLGLETEYEILALELFQQSGELKKVEELSTRLETRLNSLSVDESFEPLVYSMLIALADYHAASSHNQKALNNYNEAYRFASNLQDSTNLIRVQHSLGKVYQSMGAFDLAIENLYDAANIAQLKQDDASLIFIYNQLAISLQEIENFEQAETYLFKMKDLVEQYGKDSDLGYVYGNLSYNYLYRLDYEKALAYVELSIPYFEVEGFEVQLAFVHSLIGRVLINLNRTSEGDAYLEKSLEVAIPRDYDEILIENYFGKSELAVKLSDFKEGEAYLNKALEISQNAQLHKFRYTTLEMIVDIREMSGDYLGALNAQKLKENLKDSLFAAQKNFQIAQLNTQFETAKKDETILQASLNLEKQKTRTNAFLTMLGAAGTIIIGLAVFYNQLKRARNKLKNQNEIISSQNDELSELNSTKDKFFSIIAHDLRSPMIGLQGVGQKLDFFIKKNKQEKLLELGGRIDQSIDQLNHLLNNLLNWASVETQGIPYMPDRLDLNNLVNENIELYRSLAESKQIDLIFEPSKATAYADANTVSTIIRNLMSNAIKFTKPGGQVELRIIEHKDSVSLSIIDQGMGLSSEEQKELFTKEFKSRDGSRGEKGFGLGLRLCAEFTQLNKGSIRVESQEGEGATFILDLPISGAAMQRIMNVA